MIEPWNILDIASCRFGSYNFYSQIHQSIKNHSELWAEPAAIYAYTKSNNNNNRVERKNIGLVKDNQIEPKPTGNQFHFILHFNSSIFFSSFLVRLLAISKNEKKKRRKKNKIYIFNKLNISHSIFMSYCVSSQEYICWSF